MRNIKKKTLVRLRLSTDVKSSFLLRNRFSDSLVNFSLVSWGLAAFAVAVYTLFKVNLLTEVSNKGKPDHLFLISAEEQEGLLCSFGCVLHTLHPAVYD